MLQAEAAVVEARVALMAEGSAEEQRAAAMVGDWVAQRAEQRAVSETGAAVKATMGEVTVTEAAAMAMAMAEGPLDHSTPGLRATF